jgi:transposase
MTNTVVAFFMIHPNRSKEAFQELVGDWTGVMRLKFSFKY